MVYEQIVELAKESHGDQEYGNYPYICHLYEVKIKVYDLFGGSDHTSHAAILHDIIEDTEVTADKLLSLGVDPLVVEAVILVSKTPEVGYTEYLRKLSSNTVAWKVKVADTHCNLTESIKEGNFKRVRKYSSQLEKLYKLRKEFLDV